MIEVVPSILTNDPQELKRLVGAAEGNLHSFRMTFQNLDEENVTSDYRDDLDRCESQGLFDVLILQTTLFGESPFPCLQQGACIQKALVLRC